MHLGNIPAPGNLCPCLGAYLGSFGFLIRLGCLPASGEVTLSVANKMIQPAKKFTAGPRPQHPAPLGELKRELSHQSWKIWE